MDMDLLEGNLMARVALTYLEGFAACQGNPLIVILVTVTGTSFLHSASAVAQRPVRQQTVAVEAAVAPKQIILTHFSSCTMSLHLGRHLL